MNDNEMQESQNKKSVLPAVALELDLFAVISFFLGWGCFYSGVLYVIGGFLFLATALLPFGAVITGICALCRGKRRIGTGGIVCSVIAIALPVLVVLITVLVFSTGLAVIRWM